MRVPTEKQYRKLLALGSGAAGLSWTTGEVRPLLGHGWVTAKQDGRYWHWVRITSDGLRALAAAVDRYGLPAMSDEARVSRRVCADCESARYKTVCSNCGSAQYRFEQRTAEEVIAA